MRLQLFIKSVIQQAFNHCLNKIIRFSWALLSTPTHVSQGSYNSPTHPPTHPENIIALRIKESNKDVEELIDSQLINKLEQWRGVMGFRLTIIFSLYLFCFQLEEKEWSQHVDGYSLVGHCTTFHSIPWVVFCTFTITFLHTFIVPCWQVSTRSGVETVYSARACLCFFFLLLFHTPSGIKVGLMLSLESQCI